ncbi:unnamed protein product [Oppiella nova]|uniref:NR LBD domain-containing protein n=1 Tax=Oppiella nova TaxID=334625 RepID=A0A7R9QQ99_9ACAR|nr:unnamed protein product [Oppiella nova]CAG2171512.1 unnamed protein product [Oppiella nova]
MFVNVITGRHQSSHHLFATHDSSKPMNNPKTETGGASPLPLRPVSTPVTAIHRTNCLPNSPNSMHSRSHSTTPELNYIQSQHHSVITTNAIDSSANQMGISIDVLWAQLFTYQCSYTLSPQSISENRLPEMVSAMAGQPEQQTNIVHNESQFRMNSLSKREPEVDSMDTSDMSSTEPIPRLIQDILSVEHLWHNADKESDSLGFNGEPSDRNLSISQDSSDLCNIADHRLYKIVKWCKSLPLFREIQMDDQIALLINSWCELLLLSCCYRSISTPNEIRLSSGKSVTLEQSQQLGLGTVIERMLNLTEHLRRLQFDQYEYCCLKVIILLTSDASGLKESDKVRSCQKQVLEALQTYTRTHYPSQPSKFGELLLRIPDLERTSQVGKESLVSKQKEGDVPSFNLLMELLRGDH